MGNETSWNGTGAELHLDTSGQSEFLVQDFFPETILRMITNVRVEKPHLIRKSALRRRRRKKLTKDGKLAILACDHPARGVTRAAGDSVRMGNRHEYLGRILRVAVNPDIDGIMGTTDIIEDLLIVDQMLVDAGRHGFLDDKVLLGCMNRGGLSGCSFEMDDRFTSFTVESIRKLRLDGAKLMFRLDKSDDRSLRTMDACAKAITELNRWSVPVFLEAFSVEKTAEGYKVLKTSEELIKTVGVATALGDSSKGIWLKIPFCEGFERVAKATACPILMLGGESTGDPSDIFREFSAGMRSGSNVRGALVGRNVLFPGSEDPFAVAGAVSGIVHHDLSVDKALEQISNTRGERIDQLSPILRATEAR